MKKKGRIPVGMDADLVALDLEGLKVRSTFSYARGEGSLRPLRRIYGQERTDLQRACCRRRPKIAEAKAFSKANSRAFSCGA